MAGGEGHLHVEAAGVAVDVDDLAGEVQSLHLFRLHRFRIQLLHRDAALGDDGLLEAAGAADREVEIPDESRDLLPCLAVDLGDLPVDVDALGGESCREDRNQLRREQIGKRIPEFLVPIGIEIPEQATVELRILQRRLQVDMHGEELPLFMVGSIDQLRDDGGCRDDHRTTQSALHELELAEIPIVALSILVPDIDRDVSETESLQTVGIRLMHLEGDEGRIGFRHLEARLLSETVAIPGRAGRRIAAAAGRDNHRICRLKATIRYHTTNLSVPKLDLLHLRLIADLDAQLLDIVLECIRDAVGMIRYREDTVATLNLRPAAVRLQQIDRILIREVIQRRVQKTRIRHILRKEILDGRRVRQIAAALSRDEDLLPELIILFY